jgi:hypothetical protein
MAARLKLRGSAFAQANPRPAAAGQRRSISPESVFGGTPKHDTRGFALANMLPGDFYVLCVLFRIWQQAGDWQISFASDQAWRRE